MDEQLKDKCFTYRVKHNLSQEQMAKLCRVHWLTILHIEQGKSVRKMTAAKVLSVIERR